jgi:GR25 family glycosyltransferase involved in LPS biosynthesis
MKFSEIPKFVINLKSRTDRLKSITEELNYLGWTNFEVFDAINKNSYMGCTLSHLGVIKIAMERGYSQVMVIEDDCVIMPYSKSFLEQLESQIGDIDFCVMNLGPTLNRPVNRCEKYDLLLDLTNIPPKPYEYLTETFATNMMIYDCSIYEEMFKIADEQYQSGDYTEPIDGYLVKKIYPRFQSYCPILPIGPQQNSYSDVSHGMYNNFYTQTYNWNLYSPVKIPSQYLNETNNKQLKISNIHEKYEKS